MKEYTQRLSKDKGYGDVWLTPRTTFDILNKEFNFKLDPCTEANNPLGLDKFYSLDNGDNGLHKPWDDVTFCNPPYSNIVEWVKKAFYEYIEHNKTIVMLIPARTDVKWFHKYIARFAEVRFVEGRLKFSQKGTAPFPSMVVIFGGKANIIKQKRGY